MGRRPHSPHELWLHGTAKSQAAAPTESAVRAGRPPYPPGLTPAARKVFKSLVAVLERRRALTPGDGEALRLYAILYDRHARALATVEAEGALIREVRYGRNGEGSSRTIKHPALAICQESEKQMTSILRDLCLTVATKDKSRPTAQPAPQPQKPGELIDVEALLEQQGGNNALPAN